MLSANKNGETDVRLKQFTTHECDTRTNKLTDSVHDTMTLKELDAFGVDGA